jgi:hypothetical protein
MSDPTQNVPADRPFGQRDGDFEFRALGPRLTGAVGIGAVVELANQFHRPLQGMEAAIAVVANVHSPPTDRTIAVQDVEFPLTEIGVLGPVVRHRANLPVEGDPSVR